MKIAIETIKIIAISNICEYSLQQTLCKLEIVLYHYIITNPYLFVYAAMTLNYFSGIFI